MIEAKKELFVDDSFPERYEIQDYLNNLTDDAVRQLVIQLMFYPEMRGWIAKHVKEWNVMYSFRNVSDDTKGE